MGDDKRTGLSTQTLNGFLLTRNWRDGAGGVELEFWFASDEGAICVQVLGEHSVFFVASNQREKLRQLIADEAGIDVRPLALRDFSMTAVDGVYCRSYRQSRALAERLRAEGLEPLEADINPADRYLMERFIAGGAEIHGQFTRRGKHLRALNPSLRNADYRPDLRLVSFDIETAMQGVQLYSIAAHGVAPGVTEQRVFMLGEGTGQDYVHSCASQEAVLQAFIDWLQAFDPDVLIGWNVINFDCWYLQRVADAAGRRLLLGRDSRAARWRNVDSEGERRSIHCPGRVVLDGIDMLRAAFYNFESFALDHVAHELLGEGKLIHGSDRGEEIGRLFREDKAALAAYNLQDCELVTRIFDATSMLDFAIARSVITGLNMDRMGGSVASFDNLYLPRLHRAGYVAPNASVEHIASPGGWVLDSIPGLYNHVLVLDFKSLYPSIIRSFAIDPLGLALGVCGELAEADTVPGFLDARFAREGHILPQLIQQLWAQRDAARKAGDAPLSQAIKIIMNSFYGVLGTPGCRFFDARLASSITRRGHQILKRTRDHIEQSGHRVIYGDTDSVFVWIQDAASDAEAEAAGTALQASLNTWWRQQLADEFGVDSALELEFETHYKRFLMPTIRGSDKGSKKRYAGLVGTEDGDRLVFKGLESVRTDWTRLARTFQEELYARVFADRPYAEFICETNRQLLAGERDDQLVYRKRLRRKLDEYQRNLPPHVQAARLYESRGLAPPSRGDWVEYVMTSAGAEPAAAYLAPLDYEHYSERQLQPVADGILGLLGSSFRSLVDQQIDLF